MSRSIQFIQKIKLLTKIAVSLLILYAVFFFWHAHFSPYFHTIKIYNNKKSEWHGWIIKHDIEEHIKTFPDILPYIKEENVPYGGETVYWEDEDGMYLLSEIIKKTCLQHFFCSANGSMPTPFLISNKDNELSHLLGTNLGKGLYYINQCNSDRKGYYLLPGYFIEIEDSGWRIADPKLKSALLIKLSSPRQKKESVYTFSSNISGVLTFGKYILIHQPEQSPILKGELDPVYIEVF